MTLSAAQIKGLKLTKHKLAILQLFNVYKHLDASKIHMLLNSSGTNISLATIYRVLSAFEGKGIIVKHNFNEDQSIYELANPDEHHDHLICTKCHKVIEFFDCQIEQIQKQIALSHKFTILNHHLNLYGICADCDQVDE
ncbi:MAG: Fur family transcriptional regulator [Burkholderiales bacterium]